MLGDEKPSVGMPIEEKLGYYIDRTLECIQNAKPDTQNESQLLLPLRKDSMEEPKGISACRENNCKICDYAQMSLTNENEKEPTRVCCETNEMQSSKTIDPCEQKSDVFENEHRNLERKSTRVWRPSTLLEGENRILFVIDEPGMGTSTLLSHLA